MKEQLDGYSENWHWTIVVPEPLLAIIVMDIFDWRAPKRRFWNWKKYVGGHARVTDNHCKGSWCARWTVCWAHFQSSSIILRRTVGWKVRSSGIVLAWSWCTTGMISTWCLAFWRLFWPCWGDPLCHCLLHPHAWQCYQGRWFFGC